MMAMEEGDHEIYGTRRTTQKPRLHKETFPQFYLSFLDISFYCLVLYPFKKIFKNIYFKK